MASTAATLLPCKAGLTFVGGAVKWEWASRVSGRVGIDPNTVILTMGTPQNAASNFGKPPCLFRFLLFVKLLLLP